MQIGPNFRIMKYVKFKFSTSQKQPDRFVTTQPSTQNGSPLKTEKSHKKSTQEDTKKTRPRLNSTIKNEAGEHNIKTTMEVGEHGIYL